MCEDLNDGTCACCLDFNSLRLTLELYVHTITKKQKTVHKKLVKRGFGLCVVWHRAKGRLLSL